MTEQRPSPEEIVQALYGYAAELMKSGQSDWQVKSKLMEKGVDEQSASIVIENLRTLRERCVNCEKGRGVRPFTLSRAMQRGKTIVVRRGTVLLCDDCHKFFSGANVYRFSGIATVLFGGCMFFFYPNASYPPLWTICIGAALLLVGTLLVIKGGRRIATLEKRVGFK